MMERESVSTITFKTHSLKSGAQSLCKFFAAEITTELFFLVLMEGLILLNYITN